MFAGLYLDQASDCIVCLRRAVHAGFTGTCVLGTGLGKYSVPVVGDRSLGRVDLLVMIAVAASNWTASLLSLFLMGGELPGLRRELLCEPVAAFLFLRTASLLTLLMEEEVVLRLPLPVTVAFNVSCVTGWDCLLSPLTTPLLVYVIFPDFCTKYVLIVDCWVLLCRGCLRINSYTSERGWHRLDRLCCIDLCVLSTRCDPA